ncbi:hypothetical protein [Azospirillum palustre]
MVWLLFVYVTAIPRLAAALISEAVKEMLSLLPSSALESITDAENRRLSLSPGSVIASEGMTRTPPLGDVVLVAALLPALLLSRSSTASLPVPHWTS